MAQRLVSKRERSPPGDRPNMSDLRIVLVGKNTLENNKVGNLILNKIVFGKNMSQHVDEMFSEIVEGRNITVFNTTNLLNPELKQQTITRKVSAFCPPEPDVIILVLQHKDFSQKIRDRLPSVLNCFGEQAMKRTTILTTDETRDSELASEKNKFIQEISTECGGCHLQLQNTQHSQLLQKVDEIITRGEFKESQQSPSLEQEHSRATGSHDQTFGKHDIDIREWSRFNLSATSSKKQKLNLVLCGSDGSLTVSVSKLLRGIKIKLHQRASSKECVKKEEKIHGQQISLVELPALSRLSEEEVMRQTLCSVSLCDPGVHVFLLIVPFRPINNDERAEIEKIQKTFCTKNHFIVIFINDTFNSSETDFVKHSPESQRLISLCEGQYRMIGLKEPENSRQIPELLEYIENMKTEPYSAQMYVKAQEDRVRRETEEKYKEELKRMEDEIKELKQKIQSEGAEGEAGDLKCLRIVLIGRTGSGKSATGNTILGRNEFNSRMSTNSVTTVCEKRVGEVDGRSLAVVDTPGLFDTTLSNKLVVEEIMKCVSLSSPGPHVFVIVLSLGRFTKEETDTLDLIKRIFGPKSAQFSIVLFTRGDDLKKESIQNYVRESNSAELKKLIRDCGNRFLSFNNNENQDRTQVIQLLNMIEDLKHINEGRYFTNSMFEEAEMSIKKKMEEIMKEREREIQTQKEELQAKYEKEMKDMMKRLEEEKRKTDEEKMKMENQFREKEEKLRKEFEERNKTEQKKREIENQKRSEEEEQQRAEYHQKIEEMKRETENQRSLYEKQQKEREEEDRKREEKYRQDQEKMKNEQERIIGELQMKQEEETKKRETEEKRRIKEEEEERQRWERKIKEAENDRKETQEEIKRQQREWEVEKIRQMRKRVEEEIKRKEKHEKQLREKQQELEKMRRRFEREREEERQKIEEERQKQRREREEKEREYEEKKTEMERHYERLERERKEEWEKIKQEDEERREEDRKRWERKIEDLKEKQEEEKKRRETERKEREEKAQDEIKQKYEDEIKAIKEKHQGEARKQAEELNVFKEGKEELQKMLEEHQEQHGILEKLYQLLQSWEGKEMKELQQKVEKLHQQLKEQKGEELKELKEAVEKLLQVQEEKKKSLQDSLESRPGRCIIL